MAKDFTQYTDQELLRFIQQKNEQAFAAIYEKYYLPLCKKAFQRIPSVPRVEEIVQDVFVNLWMKSSSLDTEGNLKAYLYATMRNKILHELRTEATRLFYTEKIKKLKIITNDVSLLDNLYARETENQIQQIIDSLSPQCREAFLLSRYEHLHYQEIAERMHLSVSTVEKHIAKALRILRNRLSERGELAFVLLLLSIFSF